VAKWATSVGDPKRQFCFIKRSDDKIRFYISNSSQTLGYIEFATALTVGRWYHVAVTYDSSDGSTRIRIWDDFNSQQLAADQTGTISQTPYDDNAPLTIGTIGDLTPESDINAWDGLIDEVVIFKDVLSVAEIDQIRQGTYNESSSSSSSSESSSSSSSLSSSTSISYEPFENFLDYTEVDSATNPAITISSWNTITFTNMRRDITGYVYNDFGPSAFKSFEIEFQANASDSQNDGTATVFAVSNTLGSIQSHIDANDGTLVIFSNNGGNFAVTLIDYNTDDSDSYIYGGTTIPLRYYTVKRSSNNATLEIYSDSNRTVLVDTLSIFAATTPSRYLYALQSRNTGSSTRITGTTRYFEIVNTSSSSSSTSESSSSSSESSSSSSESSSSTSVIPISAAATYIIDSSKIDSDLVNFPLGISGSSFMDGISPSANLHAQVNGTECYVEVDIWDVDKAVIWVNVPLVVSGSDTEIVLGYSEGVNTYIGTVGTSAAQQVWDDGFLVVYHMTQTPLQVTDEIKDSTSNEIHATSNANIGNLVAGGFGKAITFNDNNGALTTAAFSRGTNAISVDLFVDAGTHPADGGWIVNQRDAVTNDQWQVAMYNPPDLTGAHLDVLSSPSNIVGTANSANVANAGWTYISYATSGTNGSDIIAYKNGDLEETDQLTNDADFSGSVEMIFGNRGWDSGSQGNYIGKISEFRLSTVVRSPAYMKATAAIFNGTLTRVSSSSSSSSESSP
jgi:hypothetical protein